MRILCAIHPPDAIRKILDCLGLPSRPPPICSAIPENKPYWAGDEVGDRLGRRGDYEDSEF